MITRIISQANQATFAKYAKEFVITDADKI